MYKILDRVYGFHILIRYMFVLFRVRHGLHACFVIGIYYKYILLHMEELFYHFIICFKFNNRLNDINGIFKRLDGLLLVGCF